MYKGRIGPLTLYEKGNEVLAIDEDKDKIEEVKTFVSHAVHMDVIIVSLAPEMESPALTNPL